MAEPTVSPTTTVPYVFVLWGDKFEEETATIFVTELRRVGIRVKVVGVSGPSATGLHGLTLRPDMMLGEASPLAQQATCVILPCDLGIFKRIQEDPRITTFLHKAADNGARFVGHRAVIEQLQFAMTTGDSIERIYTHEKENPIEFAQALASELLNQ